MFLKKMKEARKYEMDFPEHKGELSSDGLCYNPYWREFDTSDRSHWAYVGLNDEQFERKKKILDEFKEALEMQEKEVIESAYFYRQLGWAGVTYYAFFEVYENERDLFPIAYLVISDKRGDVFEPSPDFTFYDKAMALYDEVEDWEPGKIQALLMNRLCQWQYVEDESKCNFIPFDDDDNSRRIKASCENDAFALCKMERNTKLSEIEKEEFKNAFKHIY